MNCLICGHVLDPILHDVGTHPNCEQDQEDGLTELAQTLKKQMTEVILWADANSKRSLQVALGPSEIGTPCDRKLAYKLAGNPEVNHHRDPWAAIVGTSVHKWLEKAVDHYQGIGIKDMDHWDPPEGPKIQMWTEEEVQVDLEVPGHVDLYDVPTETVIDTKTAGPDVFRRIVKEGPPAGYKIQAHLYGLGYTNAGRNVKNVALMFYPRAGLLRDLFVWTDIYRPNVAYEALARRSRIQKGIETVDIWNNPHVYDKIPAVSDHCGYCPFYKRAGFIDGTEATNEGCPGV